MRGARSGSVADAGSQGLMKSMTLTPLIEHQIPRPSRFVDVEVLACTLDVSHGVAHQPPQAMPPLCCVHQQQG